MTFKGDSVDVVMAEDQKQQAKDDLDAATALLGTSERWSFLGPGCRGFPCGKTMETCGKSMEKCGKTMECGKTHGKMDMEMEMDGKHVKHHDKNVKHHYINGDFHGFTIVKT